MGKMGKNPVQSNGGACSFIHFFLLNPILPIKCPSTTVITVTITITTTTTVNDIEHDPLLLSP
jgi:hypothetical protein